MMRLAGWIAVFGLTAGLAQAEYRTIEQRNIGQWTYTASRDDTDGSASCAVSTYWHDTGRELRLTALEQPYSLNLAVNDPRWRMTPGSAGVGRIFIDGQGFTADFRAISPTLVVTTLAQGTAAAQRFIYAFQRGNNMNLTLPWGQNLQVGLRGTWAATDTMFTCVRNLFGQARAPAPPPMPVPPPTAPVYPVPPPVQPVPMPGGKPGLDPDPTPVTPGAGLGDKPF